METLTPSQVKTMTKTVDVHQEPGSNPKLKETSGNSSWVTNYIYKYPFLYENSVLVKSSLTLNIPVQYIQQPKCHGIPLFLCWVPPGFVSTAGC